MAWLLFPWLRASQNIFIQSEIQTPQCAVIRYNAECCFKNISSPFAESAVFPCCYVLDYPMHTQKFAFPFPIHFPLLEWNTGIK